MKTTNSIKTTQPDKTKLQAITLKSRKANCPTIQNPSCGLFGITEMQAGVYKFVFVKYAERLNQTWEPLEHPRDKSLIPGNTWGLSKKAGIIWGLYRDNPFIPVLIAERLGQD